MNKEMASKDTYFLKKKKKADKAPKYASMIFPKAKKTIIEPIKLKVLPEERMDEYTLTPYDIDPVDGLPTAEYLENNQDLISMTSGPAKGMLMDKLRRGREKRQEAQDALLELPLLTRESIDDRKKGTIALLNVMDNLPAQIRGELLALINSTKASTPPAVAPPPPSPPPLLGPALPSSPMVPSRPASPVPIGATGSTVATNEKDAFDKFKSAFDSLPTAEDQKQVLKNLRELLGLKGKKQAEIFKELQSQPLKDLQTKYSAQEVRLKGSKYDSYKDVMKPYSVYGMGLKKKKSKRSKKGGVLLEEPHVRFFQAKGYYPLWYYQEFQRLNARDAMREFNRQPRVIQITNQGRLPDTGSKEEWE